jgi:6-methylsalicylate decarboxylase
MHVIDGAAERGTAADTFRRLFWDTALSWSDPVLHLLRSVVGVDRVLYGSDFPYLRRDLAVRSREHLARTEALSDAERAGVLGESARKLLPRVAQQTVKSRGR